MPACRNALCNVTANTAAHPGLLLACYAKDLDDKGEAKKDLLVAAKSASNQVKPLYEVAFNQWESSLPKKDDARMPTFSGNFKVLGRLVIGLGSEGVLETGLTLHHTYGTPIIPGSALKGLAYHYAADVWGPGNEEYRRKVDYIENGKEKTRIGKYLEILFGSQEDAGHIIFHDAWILPGCLENSLCLDVMTVHHPDYYMGAKPPTDFDDPTPIPFLSVQGTFKVAVSCDVGDERGQQWAKLALTLLTEALKEWGIGGKTNSGYGRMCVVQNGAHDNVLLASRHKRQDKPVPNIVPPRAGTIVSAKLLQERTRRGGWRAEHEPTGLSGSIQQYQDMPDTCNVGDVIELVVASSNEREIQFKYVRPQ